jgi:hypothetical protein
MEVIQEQDNEKRLFCIDCGNWGWEENGLWMENYDGDTYIGQVWICIHCIEENAQKQEA